MNHRSSIRVPVRTDVDIQFPGREFVAATTRDLSHKGMFIETGGLFLPPHAMVQIRLWTDNTSCPACFQILGVVARRTKRGFGLMFVHGLEKAQHHLQTLIGRHKTVS